jgi:excinuclease ABC subunit A
LEGNSIVVIEHNLEFIAQSDYVIDLGPGGGDEGGRLLAAGSPLAISRSPRSFTGRELRRVLGLGGPAARVARAPARRAARI